MNRHQFWQCCLSLRNRLSLRKQSRIGQQQLPFTALLRSIDETAAAIAAWHRATTRNSSFTPTSAATPTAVLSNGHDTCTSSFVHFRERDVDKCVWQCARCRRGTASGAWARAVMDRSHHLAAAGAASTPAIVSNHLPSFTNDFAATFIARIATFGPFQPMISSFLSSSSSVAMKNFSSSCRVGLERSRMS
jgi:hypothetical protein